MPSTTTARTDPDLRGRHPDAVDGSRRPGGRGPALRALVVLLLCGAAVPLGTSPAAAATDVARDGFTRTVTSGLGTAEAGGAWTLPRAASDFSVSGGAAHLKVGKGLTRAAYLDSVALTDVDAATTFSTTTAPTGSGAYETLVVRRRNGSDYGARLILSRSGSVQVALHRDAKALKTVPVAGLTVSPGTKIRVHVQAEGTNPTLLRARVWRVGVGEPSRWQVTASDSTPALQGAGSVGVRSYLSSSATSTPVVTDVDDVSASDVPNQLPQPVWSTASPSLTVSFDGSQSRDAEGPIVSWAWTFGDGATGSGPRVSHTYARPGTYTVTLTVRDTDGASVTSTNDSVIALASEAQWLADVARALVGAKDYLDSQQSVAHRAIVLDVDNTAVIGESPRGRAVPAVLDVATRAEQDGYEVLFASSRPDDSGATVDELRSAGYQVDSSSNVCHRDPRAASVEASKTACRTAWAAQGFTIVANIGNRQEDLTGPSSGRTYLLPSYGYLDRASAARPTRPALRPRRA